MSDVDVRGARPEWHRVEARAFVFAALEAGRWWVLRFNDFPDHPMFTLFVGGQVVGDLNDAPREWGLQPYASLPVLGERARAEVLALMRSLGPYGSEVGAPCDGDWCTCAVLTPEYVSALVPPIGA